jgi:hypothetical protein
MRSALLLIVTLAGCITEPGIYVHKTGAGDGLIVSDPIGIHCGEQCGGFLSGPTTLTVTAAPGSRFIGWHDETCSVFGTEPCLIDIPEDLHVDVEAAFEEPPAVLSIVPPEHGRVVGLVVRAGNNDYPAGYGSIDCPETACTAVYRSGERVFLSAHEDLGYAFATWSDGSKEKGRYVTMNADLALGVMFVAKP